MLTESENTVSRSRAIRRLLQNIRLPETVSLSPHKAIGRIASHDIFACNNVPEQACSVRDGFALRTEDIATATPMEPVRLAVTQTIRAESMQADPIIAGNAARVLTGGMIPPGADGVLAEEDVEIKGDTISILTPIQPGKFMRAAGGEIGRGDTIIQAGQAITPQAAGVMVRTRVSSIKVYQSPTAQVISLGSELFDPGSGEECEKGCFPADNLVLASGLLEQSGLTVQKKGVLPDSTSQLTGVLSADDLPNLIVTTGGTGRSERDFARSCVQATGFEIIVDHIGIRPGHNMFAARKGETLLFGLPGPPAAVFACFHAILLPVLRSMLGLIDTTPRTARLRQGITAKPSGERVVLCRFERHGAVTHATPLVGKKVAPMLAIGLADGVIILQSGKSLSVGDEAIMESVALHL